MANPRRSKPLQPLFRKEERRELRYLLSIAIAETLSWLFWLIPTGLRYRFADAVALAFHRSTNTYRDNVQANVRQVLGPAAPEDEVKALARGIFAISGRNFMDLITMPRWSRAELLAAVEPSPGAWDTIDRALAEGRGVIFMTGHLGCFDFLGQAFWAKGYRMTVVTGRTTSRFIFDGVTHLRASKGSHMVEPTPSGVRSVLRALRRGDCAVIVCDRDFFQNGREVRFFGRATTLPPGIVRIARDTGAMVVPVFTRRKGRRNELRVLEPFQIERTSDLEGDMERGFETVVGVLEEGIRDSIAQWVMFQRVWPETAPPPVRVFPVGSPLESELLEKVAAALPERPILPDWRSRPADGEAADAASSEHAGGTDPARRVTDN